MLSFCCFFLDNRFVSVGKSTVLNALLGDKYTEVSMQRTTAGVNLFRIINTASDTLAKRRRIVCASEQSNMAMDDNKNGSDVDNKNYQSSGPRYAVDTAASVHRQICQDNKTLRQSGIVHEKYFNIELKEPICAMRQDTQLVLIDIPGINEADSSSKYKEYVTKNWDTFDCVIVVMDAMQGVNTEEQVELLRLIKKNNQDTKNVRTIILGNKMDDPHDKEKNGMVKESRSKAIEIFGSDCSEDSVSELLKAAKDRQEPASKSCAYLPISALHAFIYRKASRVTFEEFNVLDEEIVDRIGHEEVGRKWKKMTPRTQFDTIREAVGDPEEYKDRLSSSNFDKFQTVLSHFVGGKETQTGLLRGQLQVQLKQISHQESIVNQIKSVYEKAQAIGTPVADLPHHFWRTYKRLEESAYEVLYHDVEPVALKEPFSELVGYYEFVKSCKWMEQEKIVKHRMKNLLRKQLSHIIEKSNEWDLEKWFRKAYSEEEGQQLEWVSLEEKCWENLSPLDWITLLSSVCLVSNDRFFIETLGVQKIAIDKTLMLFTLKFDESKDNLHFGTFCSECKKRRQGNSSLGRVQCHPCQIEKCCNYKHNAFVAAQRDPKKRKLITSLEMPDSITDPYHWGHLAWEYINFQHKIAETG